MPTDGTSTETGAIGRRLNQDRTKGDRDQIIPTGNHGPDGAQSNGRIKVTTTVSISGLFWKNCPEPASQRSVDGLLEQGLLLGEPDTPPRQAGAGRRPFFPADMI